MPCDSGCSRPSLVHHLTRQQLSDTRGEPNHAKTRLRRPARCPGLSLVAVSCGGDDDESTGTDVETTAAASTETSAAAPETTEAAVEIVLASRHQWLAGEGGPEGASLECGHDTARSCPTNSSLGPRDADCQGDPFTDPNYAGETYRRHHDHRLRNRDRRSDGIEYASEIQGVTRDGEKCEILRFVQGPSSTPVPTSTTTASPATSR